MSGPLLEVSGLSVDIRTSEGNTFPAVEDVTLALRPGQTIGIVGESGSGKSITLRAIQGILPGAARVSGGEIRMEGKPIDPGAGHPAIAMVFQDPLNSLNPVFTIGNQIVETIRFTRRCSRGEARARAVELLGDVGLSEPARRMSAFPHQLSGGMRQRVMIALALARDPRVLLADEPTTALDVTVQDQILLLLERTQAERRLGMVMVSHDIGVIAQVADWVMVMYAGRIVESGPADRVLSDPAHPYTAGLLRAVPRMDDVGTGRGFRAIDGQPPTLATRANAGCAFQPRCPSATDACRTSQVAPTELEPGRQVACLHPEERSSRD
ncbi:ABC transporter ATP-binding protein [Rhizohabitans arisaemae]|uniref:ABC transporter ATP-binding protein n=1 Tax=Rhizohabitans arisaemae TaxID=2720610 RepID=UPI0024B16AC9|nr:ABC transporter ATP-binding protein [Rhizohabitans arisaemae]